MNYGVILKMKKTTKKNWLVKAVFAVLVLTCTLPKLAVDAYYNLNNYEYVDNITYYGSDYFLISTETKENKDLYSFRTKQIYNMLYYGRDESQNPPSNSITNMWGTLSLSQKGAHEGIDFCKGQSETKVYCVTAGTVIQRIDSEGKLVIYNSSFDITYIYRHLSKINYNVNNVVPLGAEIGNQGMKGNASGYHVHYAVTEGLDPNDSSESDDYLHTINPYFNTYYLSPTYK